MEDQNSDPPEARVLPGEIGEDVLEVEPVRTGELGSEPGKRPVIRGTLPHRAEKAWYRTQWFQIPAGGIAGILIALPLVNLVRSCRQPRAPSGPPAVASDTAPAPHHIPSLAPPPTVDEPPVDAQLLSDASLLKSATDRAELEPDRAEPEPERSSPDPVPDKDINGQQPDAQPIPDSAPEDAAAEDSAPEDSAPEDSAPEDEAPEDEAVEATSARDEAPEDLSPVDQPGLETGKLPVPSAGEQEQALRQVRQVMRDELAAAKTRVQFLELAKRLVELGQQTTDDPATRYVLFQLAVERAGEAGNLEAVVQAIDGIDALYEIDAWASKAAELPRLLRAARQALGDPSLPGDVTLENAAELADHAADADAYGPARDMLGALIHTAQRAKLGSLAKRLLQREREIRQQEERFAAYRLALDHLASDPDDADAHLTAGRWLALVRQQWSQALPHLAYASDASLAQIAKQELAVPKTPETQSEMGRAWWEQSRRESGQERSQAARRAVFWFDRAMDQLSGLAKIELEQVRLEALAVVGDPDAMNALGVIEQGDVALTVKGAKVSSQHKITTPENLLDGVRVGIGHSKCPFEWLVTLPKVYRLQEIRLVLYATNQYAYRYAIAVSADGKKFELLADRISGQVEPQAIRFPARPVRYIRIVGIDSNYPSQLLCAREIEAYCIPPDILKK